MHRRAGRGFKHYNRIICNHRAYHHVFQISITF